MINNDYKNHNTRTLVKVITHMDFHTTDLATLQKNDRELSIN